MQDLWGWLMLLSFFLLIIGLIKPRLIIRWISPERRNRLKVLAIFLPLSLIFAVLCGTSGEKTSSTSSNGQPSQLWLGSNISNYDNAYPNSDKKNDFHSYKYLNGKIEVRGNTHDPEKAECIFIDLRKRDSDNNLTSPEAFPITSDQQLDNALKAFLPPDAKLIKQLSYKDSSLKPPASRIKVYRLYESPWLSQNFTSQTPDDSLPNNQFWIILNKVDRGYLSALIGINTSDWEETEGDYMTNHHWERIQ